MKKQLPTDSITNELSAASVFFQPRADEPASLPQEAGQIPPVPIKAKRKTVLNDKPVVSYPKPRNQVAMPPVKRGNMKARLQDTVVSRHHDTTPPSNETTMADDTVEQIRKAVKHLGKEAATHRFTPEEKRAIGDIVYTYERQGLRTSENEITRIAVNWLLLDYQTYGANSVLARLLESLHR